MNPTWFRRVGLLTVGALATTGPVLLADETAVEAGGPDSQALAAAGWRDVIDGQGSPLIPEPSRHESAIVVLESDPLARRAAADRKSSAGQIAIEQRTLEASLTGLGATVNFRYQNVVNGLAIRIPAGRLPLVAALPGVRAVHPVTYMAPSAEPGAQGTPLPDATPAPTPTDPGAAAQAPATVALIDAGVHAQHPWLGGGIGNTRLIVGGADFVQGNPTPESLTQARVLEAHGTEMASLVLNADVVRELPADRLPRMFAYRVMAPERVDGRTRMLARSDRVIAAMDRAVDPDENADFGDRASVILLGVSRGSPTSGDEPVREAAENAERVGSVVVAPAGNDGPSGDVSAGTVAGPAASESVLTVGAAGAGTQPRTGSLALSIGPTSARLTGLPLIGAAPTTDALPVVVLAGSDGIHAGGDLRDYIDARGQSRVRGAVAVVRRGGESIPTKARLAAQAGAKALVIWDDAGDGRFPGISAESVVPISVVGLGREQGQALLEHRDLQVRITEDAATPTGERVASFSSRGPTTEGHSEPDLIAPGVDVETAYPGEGAELLSARVSGTSPAAAQVAAQVLRLRIDRPELTPAQIRSLLVQSARALPGEPARAQGAGRAGDTVVPRAVAIEPAIVSVRRREDSPASTVPFTISSMTDVTLSLRAAVVRNGAAVVQPGTATALAPRGRAAMNVTVPAGFPPSDSKLVLIDADGEVVASAPFVVVPPVAATTKLKIPTVDTRPSTAQVTVGVTGGGTARALEVWLVPVGTNRGEPIRMSSDRVHSEWPSGTYRFAMPRRSAEGKQVGAGSYRVRIRAVAPDGRRLTQMSPRFELR